MEDQNNHPEKDRTVDKKTNDDSDIHDDIIGENTEQTPLAKAVKGEEDDKNKQTPSEELG